MSRILTRMLMLEYLKLTLKTNNETYDVEMVNLFNFTLRDIVFD